MPARDLAGNVRLQKRAPLLEGPPLELLSGTDAHQWTLTERSAVLAVEIL